MKTIQMEQRLRNTTSKPTKFKGNHCLILQHRWTAMDSNGNWEQHQTAKEMLGSKFPLQLQTRRHDTKGVQRSGELRLENNEERRQLRTNAQTHNRNNKILQALQSTPKKCICQYNFSDTNRYTYSPPKTNKQPLIGIIADRMAHNAN